MFGFAPPFQSRLGPALQRAQMAVPGAPRPVFDDSQPAAKPNFSGQQPGAQQSARPMTTQTAPGAADTASVMPTNAPPSFMPGLSSASAFDPASAAGTGAGAGAGDAAAAGADGADFAGLLAAIFGA